MFVQVIFLHDFHKSMDRTMTLFPVESLSLVLLFKILSFDIEANSKCQFVNNPAHDVYTERLFSVL